MPYPRLVFEGQPGRGYSPDSRMASADPPKIRPGWHAPAIDATRGRKPRPAPSDMTCPHTVGPRFVLRGAETFSEPPARLEMLERRERCMAAPAGALPRRHVVHCERLGTHIHPRSASVRPSVSTHRNAPRAEMRNVYGDAAA